jgi:hypothetical protein
MAELCRGQFAELHIFCGKPLIRTSMMSCRRRHSTTIYRAGDPEASWFHVTTAYDILRHAGVDLAKKDFLGPPREA